MHDDTNAFAREVIQRGEVPGWAFRQDYWFEVERTLRDVFHVDPSAKVDGLRAKVDNAPCDTQAAFYHAEPFDVAADLAGRRGEPVTAEERERYVERILMPAPENAPSPTELGRAHPED